MPIERWDTGWLAEIKAKHPYPGGWRANSQATTAERAVVGVRENGELRRRRADLWLRGAAHLFPDTFAGNVIENPKFDFDVREFRIPEAWIIYPGKIAKRNVILGRKRSRPFTITVDGEEYALGAILKAYAPSDNAFNNFVFHHKEIRRVKVNAKLSYYNVRDFKAARAQPHRWHKRETAKSVERLTA